MKVRPFPALRPPRDLVEQVVSRPYDVLSSEEASLEAEGNEKSLYHIIKPEINFQPLADEYDERVYASGAEQLAKFQREGWLVRDERPSYYLYAQSWSDGRTQYGFVVCAAVEDYLAGRIKKHELTRADKEDDRMRHVRAHRAHVEPVFLAFHDRPVLDRMIAKYAATEPEYDFTAPDDGFRHRLWVISDTDDEAVITDEFAAMPALYIADGHHRSAAAARVGAELASEDAADAEAEHNFYMAVCFPQSQLTIMDYNRVVRNLPEGLTHEALLEALTEDFEVECKGADIYKPARVHEFSLYLDGLWYALTAKPGTYDENDPIGALDVDISSRLILDKILHIGDLRRSDRIDFVGGLRGLEELKRRVDSGEMTLALALHPVTMEQIIRIADAGKIMPPKATWFEPKLRSGLVVHTF